jgi:uncharacterized membrane protein
MTSLFAAAAVFLGIHLLVSGTRLRDTVTAAIGERSYLVLFSLASFAAITWLALAYNAVRASGRDMVLYAPWSGIPYLAIPLVAVAFLLAVPGLLVSNPTALGQENAAAKGVLVKGVLRITRHPFLWGVAIWGAIHLAANGDLASVIFFGTFALLALAGTAAIDAKRKRKMGPAWDAFAANTSNIPFGAMVAGSDHFKWKELLDWRVLAAILLFSTILIFHDRLFGVSPFPGGWLPH